MTQLKTKGNLKKHQEYSIAEDLFLFYLFLQILIQKIKAEVTNYLF